MSPKFPLLVVLVELAAQLRKRDLGMNLFWAPREQNELADGLTNGDYSPFDPAKRIHVDIAQLDFLKLREMMLVAKLIYAEVQAKKGTRQEESAKGGCPQT